MARLEIERLTYRVGTQTILDDLSLDVADGECVTVVGASGSGKSTLLRAIAGLIEISSGAITIDARDLTHTPARDRDVAMVFQSYALYPQMTVEENITFPLKMRGVDRAARRAKAEKVAGALGLSSLLARRPAELSGGQQQRVALARAIIREPKVFLFDEPLSNLDAKMRGHVRAEIGRLLAELGTTSIYVTHDQTEAMALGDRLCVLERGKIVQIGRPLDLFARPDTVFVARFLGDPEISIVEGSIRDQNWRIGRADAAAGGRRVLLGIRPHAWTLGGPIAARVERVEHLGSRSIIAMTIAGENVTWVREGAEPPKEGETIRLGCRASDVIVFDPVTERRIDVAIQ